MSEPSVVSELIAERYGYEIDNLYRTLAGSGNVTRADADRVRRLMEEGRRQGVPLNQTGPAEQRVLGYLRQNFWERVT